MEPNNPLEILVVDDDRKIVNLVGLYLKHEGFTVLAAYDGQEALNLAIQRQPALIILDLMLPWMNGAEVCQILRTRTRIPIIMLTARTTEDDKIQGLDLGADDYVTKPFSPKELMSRVRAVLRRGGEEVESKPVEVHFGDLTINFLRRQVVIRGEVVNLTRTEYRLLEILVQEAGRTFSRLELIERVFGYEYEGVDRTIDVHVMNLRKKIEADAHLFRYVVTVPGMGYRFEDSNVA
jgi:two-component system alkaline phosphatase synthesis response regulator PhoP